MPDRPTDPRPWSRAWLVMVLLVALADPAASEEPAFTREDLDLFETSVRPILVERCLDCHGDRKQESGLRLDTRAGVIAGGDLEGPAVTLDEPSASPLLLAVRHDLGDRRMPPVGKLPDDEIEALERWVDRGAPWSEGDTIEGKDERAARHWAFQRVDRVEPPVAADPAWIVSPVDAFIRQGLDQIGLAPSAPADRRTLLRRAAFDLTGLPPEPGEIDSFLTDDRNDREAFGAVVDRLLASPRYGERWGRHWLDVARYADTKGYVFQEERRFPYAYTYRDYVVAALNADKPYDRFLIEQIAADKLGLAEGDPALAAMGYLTIGRRFLNNAQDIIDDRIDVVARGMLGLTVTCARCHDHKYDPIPTADYYSLYGVFASSMEPSTPPPIAVPDGDDGPERDDYDRQMEERRLAREKTVDAIRVKIRDELRSKAAAYLKAAVELAKLGGDGRLDAVARSHDIEPARLRHVSARLRERLAADDPILAGWKAMAALPDEGFAEAAQGAIESLGAGCDPAIREFVLSEPRPTTFAEVVERHGRAIASIASREESTEPEGLRKWLDAEGSPFQIPADLEGSRIINRAERNQIREVQQKLDELSAKHPGAPPRAMALVDRAELFNPYVFVRGNQGNRGPEVPRQFLGLLSGPERTPFTNGSGRLELARAIADPANPLTARVLVNRVWMHHFGQPLVRTPSDFGLRSEPPSHPELLDWLATEFVRSGWSIKHLHGLMMVSSTYMQASLPRPEAEAIDPENRKLWRQNRRRLDFESMRDAVLAAAGRLEERIGGRPGPSAADPAATRRTLYGFIDRQNLEGEYRTFDFASPDATSPGRYKTIVPQQALFLMNSPFIAQQAEAIVGRVAGQTGGAIASDAAIDAYYATTLGRPPQGHERDLGRGFLATAPGDGPARAAQFAQVLLLTNEFMYVD